MNSVDILRKQPPLARMDHHALSTLAAKAKRYSFSPFSRFRVGAALLTNGGAVYTGCNIENSSYGLTMCAERTALFKAISEGERSFVALAIASDEDDFTPPCGACRQVIMDLAGDIDIIMRTRRGRIRVRTMSDLLPDPFSVEHLKKGRQR